MSQAESFCRNLHSLKLTARPITDSSWKMIFQFGMTSLHGVHLKKRSGDVFSRKKSSIYPGPQGRFLMVFGRYRRYHAPGSLNEDAFMSTSRAGQMKIWLSRDFSVKRGVFHHRWWLKKKPLQQKILLQNRVLEARSLGYSIV